MTAIVGMLIDGKVESPEGPPSHQVFDANTGEIIGTLGSPSARQTDAALAAAKRAQKEWWSLTAKSRSLELHALASSLEQADLRPLYELMGRELGKPLPEAQGEVEQAIPALRYYAEMLRHDQGQVAGETYLHNVHFSRYDPYGITLHLTPFNYPILLLSWTMAASLAAGNAVVVKPSEKASLTTMAFLQLFSEWRPGLVSCLSGGADVAKALVEDSRIGKIAFTGSVQAARAVYEAAARQMKPCLLEAGGSDALIVSDKVDLDIAAAGAAHGAFYYTGQVCTSIERIFVIETAFEEFLLKFKAHTEALRVGPADQQVDLGPLISSQARDRVEGFVAEAMSTGARLISGGRRPPGLGSGWFYEPTILAVDDKQKALQKEEIFGPVAVVSPVASVEDAIARANDTPFGLGASIFTEDLGEAFLASRDLEAGMVWVNNPLVDNDALPFGGRKLSGIGRELGRHGLDEFRQPKMVVIDYKPRHQSWWVPYRYGESDAAQPRAEPAIVGET